MQWSPQGDPSLLCFPLDLKDLATNQSQPGLEVILELEHEGKLLLTEKMVVRPDQATSDRYAQWMVPLEAEELPGPSRLGMTGLHYNATHIENLKSEAGTLGIQFEFAHYFEKHPCDQ